MPISPPTLTPQNARNFQPTGPSNLNSTHPTPSTYTTHPPQSSSPSGSPWLSFAYSRSPTEPHYHILLDDLSSQNTALSPRQGGQVSCEPVDHTFCLCPLASLAAQCPASKSENPMRSTSLSFVLTGLPVSPWLWRFPLSFWLMSIVGKTFQMLHMHGLLLSVRCNSDGAGFLKRMPSGGTFTHAIHSGSALGRQHAL